MAGLKSQSDDGLSAQFALPRIREAGLQCQGLAPTSELCQELSTRAASGQQEECQRHRDGDAEPLGSEKPGRHRQREALSEPAWRHLAARSLTCTRGLHPPARRPALPLEPPPVRPPFWAQRPQHLQQRRGHPMPPPLTPHAGMLGLAAPYLWGLSHRGRNWVAGPYGAKPSERVGWEVESDWPGVGAPARRW